MSQSKPVLESLDHLVLTVADLAATARFYQDALGMEHEIFETATGERRQALKFGRMKINLHQSGAEFEPKARTPAPGSADLCFLTKTPLEVWQKHLEECGLPTEEGPVPRTGATGPLASLYLRDPDGNLIEISVPAP